MRRILISLSAVLFFSGSTPTTQSVVVPLRAAAPTLRLIVTGDAGATHSQLRDGIARLQQSIKVDGILLTGDNFYPCGISSIDDPQWTKITQHFGPSQLPVFAVLGNHDYGDPQVDQAGQQHNCGSPSPAAEVDADGRVAHWHMPARDYLLRTSVADFAMIDTQPIASGWTEPFLGSATAQATIEWLRSRPAERGGRWNIIVGHHTLFSSGVHGRTNGVAQRRTRADLLPLMQQEHVDLYICGHDHDMELIASPRPGAPAFLISGAGSGLDAVKTRKAKDEPATIWPPADGQPFIGFALLEVDAHTIAVTFYDRTGTARSKRLIVRRR